MTENWNQYKDLEYYPDRVCDCGCEGLIKVRPCHKYNGIPKYIRGHSSRNFSKNTIKKMKKPKSKEHKQKLRESHTGKKQTKETIQKRIESRRNNGKLWHSKETKKKIGKSGRIVSKETKEKIRKSLIIYLAENPVSDETLQERSKSMKQLWQDPEFVAKQEIIRNNTEYKQRRSVSQKQLWQNPEYVRKQKESAKKASKKRWEDPEYKEMMKKIFKKLWQDPVYREKQLKAIFEGMNIRPNKPENFLINLFRDLLPNQYKYTGDGSVLIGYKNPDFINVNGQKKIIEYFGSYPHGPKMTGRTKIEEEQQRIEHFAKYGYQTLIIWEDELKNLDILKEKILRFNYI